MLIALLYLIVAHLFIFPRWVWNIWGLPFRTAAASSSQTDSGIPGEVVTCPGLRKRCRFFDGWMGMGESWVHKKIWMFHHQFFKKTDDHVFLVSGSDILTHPKNEVSRVEMPGWSLCPALWCLWRFQKLDICMTWQPPIQRISQLLGWSGWWKHFVELHFEQGWLLQAKRVFQILSIYSISANIQ